MARKNGSKNTGSRKAAGRIASPMGAEYRRGNAGGKAKSTRKV